MFGTAKEKEKVARNAWLFLGSAFVISPGFLVLIALFFGATGDETRLFLWLYFGLAALFLALGIVGCVGLARSKGQPPFQCVAGVLLTFVFCLVLGASDVIGGLGFYGAPGVSLVVGLCIALASPDLWAQALWREVTPDDSAPSS